LPRRFTQESPFVAYFQEKKQTLSQYDIDVRPEFKAMTREEKQWLAELGIELYVPVLREEALLGVLAFGPQRLRTAYSQQERELMLTLADQAGLALEGARLFQQLSTINEEVGFLNQRLSLLDQSKSDFLSIASHELRTPLTQIHSYSQLLLELTEEDLRDQAYVRRVFQGLAQGSERLKDIVDLMLDVSAADLGKMSLFKGPVRLQEVYEQASHHFLPALQERRLALSEEGLNELPIVDADGTRLVQVLENLISNAIKYTPDGGKIKVRGCSREAKGGSLLVEIAVIDTGIGLHPQYHRTVFDKFFRIGETLHHTTSKTKFKGGGPGLGLTLAKAIVEAHQGQIWVESPGCDEEKLPGSTFFFTLPVPLSFQEEFASATSAERT
jgi:signal transduction histidine kinase